MKGDVVWLGGVRGEETWPKDVAVMTVKAIPKLDVVFLFRHVTQVDGGCCSAGMSGSIEAHHLGNPFAFWMDRQQNHVASDS